MSKSLVIVESPAKARTIKKYLGPDYDVKASVGHIIDLPKSELALSERVLELHREILATPPAVCAERAVLVTRYFRSRKNRREPVQLVPARPVCRQPYI